MNVSEALREEFRKNPNADIKALCVKYKTNDSAVYTARKKVTGGAKRKIGTIEDADQSDTKRDFVIDMLLAQVKQMERMILELRR